MKTILNKKTFIALIALSAGIFFGWLFFAPSSGDGVVDEHTHDTLAEVWTCSMHPSVRQPGPGKCPICGMDLIPLETEGMGDGNDDSGMVTMSETAMKLANVQTMVVGSGHAEGAVRLNGKVTVDERMVSSQAAHIPGRIERLNVNFTGDEIDRGEIVAYVYSPELVTAQQELFEAFAIRDSQPELYRAAREKLKNWKLNDQQIDAILSAGVPTEHFPIRADASGVVLKRNVSVGDYVARGASLYEVVDLSKVWIQFDVHENDMRWINEGDKVTFTVKSIPGKTFTEKISFIDPVIDPQTRVASARVEMRNPGTQFKPEMFVSGVVNPQTVAEEGIVVPKSAVMWTGERSIVYVKDTTHNHIGFVLREVLLGPAMGDRYVVREGLEEGMEVVVNGAFTIDAAAQLAGKPSMMNPRGDTRSTPHSHGSSRQKVKTEGAFNTQLATLLKHYVRFKDALVSTDTRSAATAAGDIKDIVEQMQPSKLGSSVKNAWQPSYDMLKEASSKAAAAENAAIQRESLVSFTEALYRAITTFGTEGTKVYYQFCPMAFGNKGAHWLSMTEDIQNPYFGSEMLTCGETVEKIE